MEVPKNDGHGEEHDVGRVAAEEANELDNLGEGQECELGVKGTVSVHGLPTFGTPPEGCQDEKVEDEGERGEGCNVQCICAPPLLSVDKQKRKCGSVTRFG